MKFVEGLSLSQRRKDVKNFVGIIHHRDRRAHREKY